MVSIRGRSVTRVIVSMRLINYYEKRAIQIIPVYIVKASTIRRLEKDFMMVKIKIMLTRHETLYNVKFDMNIKYQQSNR